MMLADEFIRDSLNLHLFFARIMKEHALFLETSFMLKDHHLISQADYYRIAFDTLLYNALQLSGGMAERSVLQSGELLTPFTADAETLTTFLTGVPITASLTQAESGLQGGGIPESAELKQAVEALNRSVLETLSGLIAFKSSVAKGVADCKLATHLYPLMLDHLIREAKFYQKSLERLVREEKTDMLQDAAALELFGNDIMGDHAKFIRGMLDPTEEASIITANNFSNEFEELEKHARQAGSSPEALKKATDIDLIAVKQFRDFKENGVEGILGCKLRSVILPLLADHVLREANYYLRFLSGLGKAL